MAQERMLSGSLLLSAGPALGASSLGIVSGETPTVGPRLIQLTLAPEHCVPTFANGVSIRVAEEHARKLATAMQETCVRLEHLRALYKMRQLEASALMGAAVEPQARGDYSPVTNATATALVGLPTAQDAPTLNWVEDTAAIGYAAVDGQGVRITFTGTVAVRRRVMASEGTSAVFRIDGDAWFGKNVDADPEDSDLEHFSATFARCTFEVIAAKFYVTNSATRT